MNIPGKIITLDASAEVAGRRIVTLTGDDYEAAQASAASDALIGISTETGAPDGGRLDVIIDGVSNVEYGGTVAAGDPLTADAQGRAITAADGDNVVGRALIAGVSGDIGSVIIAPFVLPGE